jgi:uncharacterized damage-inducible protein DinB
MRIFAEHTDFIFGAFKENVLGLTDEELHWKPVEESNTIYNILVHTVRISYILIPQVIEGTVKPTGWDDDYEIIPHTYEELIRDLDKAKEKVVKGIENMEDEYLNDTLQLWGRDLVRKQLIFHLLREIIHHSGQIAMLKGMFKRSQLKL